MHELSLCDAILGTTMKHADGRPVTQVTVRIGHLRQVVPDALRFGWELLTEPTDLKGCELVIEQIPATVECRECRAVTTLDMPILVCGTCGSFEVTLLSGEEFLDRVDGPRRRGGVTVGRVHLHADGTQHLHDHDHDAEHDHGAGRDVGDHTGYADTGTVRVEILENLLSENDRVADANRHAFAQAGVRAVNLMSSPGAGKTTLLKRTLQELGSSVRIGVLEGDIATTLDADELDGAGATAIAVVNTSAGFGGECHLDAVMVRAGISRLPLDDIDLLVIENVGNLVCPAEFRVGEHARAMVYAVTEGEEKPLKYPVMFRAAEVVVVNKIDLLPHLDFDLDTFLSNLRSVNPAAHVIHASARTGQGVDEWCAWLRGLG